MRPQLYGASSAIHRGRMPALQRISLEKSKSLCLPNRSSCQAAVCTATRLKQIDPVARPRAILDYSLTCPPRRFKPRLYHQARDRAAFKEPSCPCRARRSSPLRLPQLKSCPRLHRPRPRQALAPPMPFSAEEPSRPPLRHQRRHYYARRLQLIYDYLSTHADDRYAWAMGFLCNTVTPTQCQPRVCVTDKSRNLVTYRPLQQPTPPTINERAKLATARLVSRNAPQPPLLEQRPGPRACNAARQPDSANINAHLVTNALSPRDVHC